MNKIYKVVWNKAKNCYVVASEFAKNHQTGSSRIKAASVAAVMAATMLTIGTGVIYAADVTDTDVKGSKETILYDNTTDKTTQLNDPNLKHDHPNSWVHGHTDQCGELTYNTTLTIGDINKVADALVANDKSLYNQGIKNVTMKKGTISLMRNDKSPVEGSIVLTGNDGKNGKDTAVTVTVGNESQTFQTGSVVTAKTDTSGKATGLTINGKSYDINAGKTYKAGDNVTIADDGTISATDTTYSDGKNVKIDDKNKISVDLSEYAKSDDVAVVYQDNDKNKSLHSTNAGTVGSSSIALGKEATTGSRSVALGDQTKATGESSTAIGVEAKATALDSIAIGGGTSATGGDSIAIGNDTTANSQYSVAIGDDIQFTGVSATAVGQQAHATGDVSTAIGTMTNIDADYNRTHDDWRKAGVQSTAIGAYAGSWGLASTAVGGFSKAEGQLATAIGYHSQANVDHGTALGDYSEVKAGWGVAIGASSVADRESGVVGAFAPEGADSLTWKANAGAVSVGSDTITRQITNVAAGSEATDAVNVAQLKAATENAGWNLSTEKEITQPTKVKSGAIVDFSGDDKNITISKEETDFATFVKVNLNRNLNVNSVHAGDFFMNSEKGIGFGDEAYITQSGLNANDKVITNVAKGEYNTDAVNVGQLKEVGEVAANANKGWNLSTNGVATEATNVAPGEIVDFNGDKNISVSHDKTKVKVELNKNLKDIETISNGGATLTLGAMGGMVSEFANGQGASVKLFGDTTTINGKVNVYKDGRIAGVADGVNANDAVNVGQLKNSAWKLAANGVLTEAEDVKAGDYVDFSGDQNVSISKDAKDGVNTVKVELNKDLTGIETISNDGASLTLNGTATELTNGKGAAITLFGDTTTINNKVTVYNDGRISGVAAGIHDTDAVNVGQLKAVGTTANMGWNLATNGVATEATNVKPGDFVDFSGDKNISVSHDGTKVKVELNKDIDVNYVQTNALNAKYNLSVGTANADGTMPFFVNSTGAFYAANNKFSVDKDGKVTATAGEIGNVVLNNGVFYKNSALRDGELFIGDADGNYSQITPKSAKLGQVTIDEKGNIAGANSIQTNALNAKYNLSVGTANENGTVPFFVNSNGAFYGANGSFVVDKDGNVTAGNVVLKNGVYTGNSALRDGELFIGDNDGNYSQITPKSAKLGQVTIDEKGNMAGVNSIQTNVLNAKYNLSVGTANENGTVPFFVNSNGAFYGANGSFVVDKDGNVTAGNVVLKNGVFTGHSALRDGELFVGDASGNYSQITTKGAKFGKVTVAEDGKISGVAAGAVTADSTDAVNGSQLHAVATEAGKHSKVVSGNNINVEETDVDGQKFYKVNMNKDIMLGDLTGKYVNISGTNGTIEATGAIATKDRVYADKGAKLADIDVTGDTISNGDAKMALNGAAGTAGMINGKGASVYMQDGYTVINSKVAFDQNGKISGVAAGAVTADSTDAVNGSQLHAVATEAGKHTTLSNGKNTTVTSTNKDGQVDYQVNVAGDLKDITSVSNGDSKINLNADSISISNGNKSFAITNSGIGMSYITADYSTKSIMLGENGTTISGGLNVAGSKITGVAAGVADTDAVNVGQLKEAVEAGNTDTHIKPGEYGVGADNTVKMDVVDKNGNKVDTVTIKDVAKASDVGDVNNIANDIKNKEGKTTVVDAVNNLNNKVGDLQYSKVEKGDIADGDSTTTAIGKLDQKLTDVAATAAKHTKVEGSSNIIVTNTAKEGEAANYQVKLNETIDVNTVTANSVTTGQTVMNNDGLKVGKDVSVTATAVTAGKTSISDEGVKVGDKTYISDKGLNANGQNITNVADGKVEKDSKDAINGGQLHQAKADINNRIDGVENQVVSNTNRINQLGSRVNKVGAGAAALAALHPMDFDPDDKLTFSAGYGNYGGENAAAIGAYYRPDEKVMFSVGGTVGNGENMVNAGVSFSLDRTNHVSNSRTAMAREILDLRAEVTELKAMVAKGGLGSIAEDKMKIFPDVAENHWAYEYVGKLAAAGIIEGYPDGNFSGDRMMSRYEFAAMLYRAMQKGAQLDSKIINEFAPEMGRIRVDRISGEDGDRDKIERVRVNAVKGERDHYGNKIAKAEAKAK